MPTVKELIEHLKENYKKDDVVAYSLWSVADVKETADRKVTKSQAEDILDMVQDRQSAEDGINWDVIKCCVESYFEEKKQ